MHVVFFFERKIPYIIFRNKLPYLFGYGRKYNWENQIAIPYWGSIPAHLADS
jgi:hypothetical protein